MNTCTKCGTQLPGDAQFCPRCGTPVAALPPQPTPPPVEPVPVVAPPPPPVTPAYVPPPPQQAAPQPPRMSARTLPPEAAIPPAKVRNARGWWIVPLVVVGLVLIGWLLLAGLPFGGEDRTIVKKEAPVPIAEGAPISTPQQTGTILELPGDEPFETPVTTAPPMPGGVLATGPAATQTVPPPATATQTPPPTETASRPPVGTPAPVTQPRPVPTRPAPSRPAPSRPAPTPAPAQPAARAEISEGEAVSTLRGYLSSANVYDGVESSCLQVRSQGYQNVGYTMSVWDSCNAGGGSRMLGRWRVDSKTREVFRQRGDGRYLRP
jgi:hypothetical protein